VLRIVLDTNVVASAILWGGTPRQLLQARREKRIEIFTSLPMLVELSEILGRRKFMKKIVASRSTIEQLVERYARLGSVVRPLPTPRIAPDLDDDVVIGTALAARADLVVTGDKPFLTVSAHHGVRIVSVAQAVEIIDARGK
jgi:hypothetical protein